MRQSFVAVTMPLRVGGAADSEVKAKGKIQTKGKDYEVQDGDILLIKAGAAKG